MAICILCGSDTHSCLSIGFNTSDWCWWTSIHELHRCDAVVGRDKCVGDDCR